MKSIEREKMMHRVKALLAKAGDPGVTENEAMAFAEKARELMDKHALSHSDIEASEGRRIEGKTGNYTSLSNAVHMALGTRIAEYAGVTSYAGARWGPGGQLTPDHYFFGFEPDVEFAKWLASSFTKFIKRRLADGDYCNALSYRQGLLMGIAKRLDAAIEGRKETHSTGPGLVLLKKHKLAEAAAKERFTFEKMTSRARRATDAQSYYAGKAAGAEVGISRPVNNGNGVAKLGG